MLEGVAGRNGRIWHLAVSNWQLAIGNCQLVKPEKLGKGYVCQAATTQHCLSEPA
jgi:hypothetical protein